MKKIVTFGDSFIQPGYAGHKGIADLLEEKLGLPGLHFGVGGSSIQYSVCKFVEYINSDQYDQSDLILFVMTSDDRVTLVDMPDHAFSVVPGSTEATANTQWFKNLIARTVNSSWITNNFKFIQFIKENLYHYSINTELLRTLSFLKCWASTNPNTIMVMTAFHTISDQFTVPTIASLITNTDNFFAHLALSDVNETSLLTLSKLEFLTDADFYKTLSNSDPRLNHFSKRNKEILASIIADVFATNDFSKLAFHKLERGVHPSFLSSADTQ